jgi:murein L,D-transpeptidase YcbB/YkuD
MSFCKNPVKHQRSNRINANTHNEKVKQDTTSIYLDSIKIVIFSQQYSLNENYSTYIESFYKKRNYEFAWINTEGINEYAKNFMNLLNNEKKQKNVLFYQSKLHTLYNILSETDTIFSRRDSLVAQFEFLLTLNFFDFAKRNWGGISKEEAKKVSWFMDRKKLNYENLLDTVLINSAQTIFSFEPVYSQYQLLKNYLQKYNDIEKKGGWIKWTDKIKKLKEGDSSSVIALVKKQLFMLEDLTVKDSSYLFDDKLADAVKKFQQRNGLKENGIIEGKTLLSMSIPIRERIKQILINMERCKWVPIEQKGDYLMVNIPDFKLYVYNNDSLKWSCNVVVGKSKVANHTVIFNDNLEEIVFSPYWNIPKNIIIKETLPEIKKNPNYLMIHDMEVANAQGQTISLSPFEWGKYTTDFPYTIRQKPGKDNALGLVKFLFPNSYSIYMHDTPAKSLFNESTRMFSHGCIRIEEPFKLAKFLLRGDSTYTDARINALMHGGKQTFVKLKNTVPVFIAYFTTWVDKDGKLNFREDVYHNDSKMKTILFKN